MMRLWSGVVAGLVVAGCALLVAWSFGWLHVGAMPMAAGSMEDMAPAGELAGGDDEHAGHDTPTVAEDEHAGHDMAASDALPQAEPVSSDAPAEMPEGAVMISPARQQLIGVRTAPVVRDDARRVIRTVGRVEYDERRVAHVHTKVSGWIETLFVDFTGEFVAAGVPLLEIYSPELVSTQEEYLLAVRAQRTMGDSRIAGVAKASRSLLEATRRRLLLWDVTEQQIAALEERQAPERTLTLYSPIEGYVIHKAAYEGQYVGPQSELFSIADLTQVWVTADVYESELPYVRQGQTARVTLSYLPGRTFRGRVDYIYPYMAGETRTAKVRIVLPNSDQALKPDMYANVELESPVGSTLLVPEDAVIDSGSRQVVLLALEGGHFLPRDVQVGARFGDRLQILSGLEEGDVVVSGAAFLIDSESKLRSALGGMAGHQH